MPLSLRFLGGAVAQPVELPPPSTTVQHLVKSGVKVGVIAGLREGATPPDGSTAVDPAIFADTAMGETLIWPRAYRNKLLAAADRTPSWRAKRDAADLNSLDAHQQTLRDYPANNPDPQTAGVGLAALPVPACIST